MGLCVALASPAAASTTLTFEGIPNNTSVGAFYGPDYVFSPATLALVDFDAGGDGNFANEPSPNTIMFFTAANNAILNVTNGFTDGFSFFYSSSTAATINVYDGLNGTGNILASLNLTLRASTTAPATRTAHSVIGLQLAYPSGAPPIQSTSAGPQTRRALTTSPSGQPRRARALSPSPALGQ